MTYEYEATGGTTGDTATTKYTCLGCDELIAEDERGCSDCLDKYGVGLMTAAYQGADYMLVTTDKATIDFEHCHLAGDWVYLHDVTVGGQVTLAQLQINIHQIVYMGTFADRDEEDNDEPETEPEPGPSKAVDIQDRASEILREAGVPVAV